MKVTARRGSQSAPDPFNVHADVNLNPDRTSSSTITIVRASPDQQHHAHAQNRSRLSFAFSSFASPSSPSSSGGGASPTSSPRLRPLAHHHHKSRLTPEQIVDLAKHATSTSSTSTSSTTTTAPATFTLLPDDVYLPFLGRPAEVAALIASPPDLRLFSLLAQTFPPDSLPPQPLPPNPIHWSYPHLIHHLTKVDRDVAPDFLWTVAARKCIFAHSELIWERVKGALGVPPELDLDVDFVVDQRNDWEETILDSPISFKSPLRDRFFQDDDEQQLENLSDGERHDDDDEEDEHMISIEPLLSPPPPASTSTAGTLGLGDIAESAEDEDEDEGSQAKEGEEEVPTASKIQGLRILTSPQKIYSRSPVGTPPPPLPSDLGDSPRLAAAVSSRTSSHSSLTGTGPFHRSESLAALWNAARQEGVFAAATSSSSVGGGSDGGFGAGEDGGGGATGESLGMGPRFPANFARLGRGRIQPPIAVVVEGGAAAQARKKVRYVG